jgi:2',3'-cyclic-nucleotide 2'-phosphodiesterase (5'-nucleotidase family)
MKQNTIQRMIYGVLLSLIFIASVAIAAPTAPIATATADIENVAPGRSETAWGRLVADALRSAGNTDLALVNAGSLNPGTLKAGTISQSQIDVLLSFPNDDVVILPITGAALRSAVELSLRAYPTSSPAFLQGSGWEGTYSPQAPAGKRLTSLKINGQDVSSNSTYQVAMPISLAQGTNGYFAYWNDSSARSLKTTMATAVANYLSEKHVVSPENGARLKAQN